MSHPGCILTIGRDTQLLQLRELVLERAGYSVVAISDHEAIHVLKENNSFKLVMFCHTVPEESSAPLTAQIKELRPDLPILLLFDSSDRPTAKVDERVHHLELPGVWLRMIDSLVREPVNSKATELS